MRGTLERDEAQRPASQPGAPLAAQRASEAGGTTRGPALVLWVSLALLALVLVAAAQAPWLRAPLAAGEYAELLDPARGGSWFARLTLAWQRAAGAVAAPGEVPRLLRLESLACLLVFVLGLASFLARALAPWCGQERARRVALVFVLLVLVHPLLVEGALPLAARPGRLALACAGLGAGLFLAGRQEGSDGRTAAALAAFFLAGLFARDACLLVPWLALAEYTSSHRHRPRALRLRTATTTLLLFGAASLLAGLWPDPRGGGVARAVPLAGLEDWLLACGGELGRLCVPVVGAGGMSALLVAGALLPLLFHPLFQAARVAPRLWGGLVLAWTVSLAGALAWWALGGARTGSARELFALAVLCAGFALGASARDPRRTLVLALAAGAALSVLAHAAARPWLEAGRVTGVLAAQLVQRVPPGLERVLVLDPPGAGLPGEVAGELGWLLHPALGGSSVAGLPFDARRVRGIAADGLLRLAHSPLAGEVLGARVLVLHEGRVRALDTRPPRALDGARRPWRTELGYAFEEGLDPRALEGVEVVAELDSKPDELERLAWRTRGGEGGEVRGQVTEERGRRVARYDLSRSLDWLLAGEVRSFTLPAGRRAIERAEFRARLPEPAGRTQPERAGQDWWFELEPPAGTTSVSLLLLELEGLRSVRLAATRRASGGLRVARAAEAFPLAAPDVRWLWALEFRAGDEVRARCSGIHDPNGDSP